MMALCRGVAPPRRGRDAICLLLSHLAGDSLVPSMMMSPHPFVIPSHPWRVLNRRKFFLTGNMALSPCNFLIGPSFVIYAPECHLLPPLGQPCRALESLARSPSPQQATSTAYRMGSPFSSTFPPKTSPPDSLPRLALSLCKVGPPVEDLGV